MKVWNLKQLWDSYQKDLKTTNSEFEQGMIKAICFKEMKELCKEIEKGRKLTPIEKVIKELIN